MGGGRHLTFVVKGVVDSAGALLRKWDDTKLPLPDVDIVLALN